MPPLTDPALIAHRIEREEAKRKKEQEEREAQTEVSQGAYTPEEETALDLAIRDSFGKIPEQFAYSGPNGVEWVTRPKNAIYSQSFMYSWSYLQQIYGQSLSPFLQASLSSDPRQRAYMYQVLHQLAGSEVEDQRLINYATRSDVRNPMGQGAINRDLERTFEDVLQNPERFHQLGTADQFRVQQRANAILNTLDEGQGQDLPKTLLKITGATATGNYNAVFNEQERAALEGLAAEIRGDTVPGTRLAAAPSRLPGVQTGTVQIKTESEAMQKSREFLGIADIQDVGGPNPVITIDQDWARGHPVRAAVMMERFRVLMPEATFKVGEKGMVGDVLELFGRGVDAVGFFPGMFARVINEGAEAIRFDDPAYQTGLAREVNQVRKSLQSGNIAEEDIPAAMNFLAHAEDEMHTDNFGEIWQKTVEEGLHPREAGYGFTENYMDSLNMLPGDSGYEWAYAVTGLLSNIAFDPLNFLLPGVSGARAGAKGVAGAAESPWRVYNSGTKFRKLMAGDDAEKAIKTSAYAIMEIDPRYTLDAANLVRDSRGAFGKPKIVQVNGKHALFFQNMTLEQGIRISRRLNLRNFIAPEGLVDNATRTVQSMDNLKLATGGTHEISAFGKTWSFNPGKTIKLKPPRIGGGYIKNWAYSKTVRTPEELVESPQWRQAMDTIWQGKQNMSRRVFMSRIQEVFGLDANMARTFAGARNKADIEDLMVAAITGNVEAPVNQGKHIVRINEIKDRLNNYDSLVAADEAAIANVDETLSGTQVVGEDGKPLRVYHGTNKTFETFDQSKSGEGLYGAGFYHTEEPTIASGYSTAESESMFEVYADKTIPISRRQGVLDNLHEQTGLDSARSVDEAFLESGELTDLFGDSEIIGDPGNRRLFLGKGAMASGYDHTMVRKALEKNGLLPVKGDAQVRFSYLDIRNPYRADGTLTGKAKDDFIDAVVARAHEMDDFPTDEFEDVALFEETLRSLEAADNIYQTAATAIGPNKVNEALQELGYDGITHIGGAITGNPPHRVWITFDPKQSINYPSTAKTAELSATRTDDIAELAYHSSMLSPRDFKLQLRTIDDHRQWQRFFGDEETTIGKAAAAGEKATNPKRYPIQRMLTRTMSRQGRAAENGFPSPGAFRKYLETGEGQAYEAANYGFAKALKNFFRPHGAGERVYFAMPGLNTNDLLADYIPQTTTNLRNFVELFGIKRQTADELIGAFLDVKNPSEAFEWLDEFWKRIADESPYLSSIGRKEVRRWKKDAMGWESISGTLSTPEAGGFWKFEPTGYRDGQLHNPVPMWSADMLHFYQLPHIDEVMEYIHFNKRLIKDWRERGGVGRKMVGGGLLQAQHAWAFVNRFWKSAVLLGRMPFGLPGRIILEEHVRMWGFDEASAINHPLEWFRALRHSGDMEAFTEIQAAHLGMLGDQFITRQKIAHRGRTISMFGEQSFYDSFSQQLMKRFKSPEIRRWWLDNDPEDILKIYEGDEGLKMGTGDILRHWDSLGENRLFWVKRMKQELDDLIGDGPDAERIVTALRTGRMVGPSGRTVRVGDKSFAKELELMVEDQTWKPRVEAIPQTEDWLWYDHRFGGVERFRDQAFNLFYTKPDLYMSRAPLFRNIAVREQKRLMSLGWNRGRANAAAKAHAARRTADMLYRIGESTSAQHFLRNIFPFFPAAQELATTWLYRVPKNLGGGFLLPGYLRLGRRGHIWMNALKQTGLVKEDSQGRLIAPLPGFGPMMTILTGSPVPLKSYTDLRSFAGLLPIPDKLFSSDPDVSFPERLHGLIPSLGAPTAAQLAFFAEKFSMPEEWVDALLPFGREINLGPRALENMLMAFGIDLPILVENGTAMWNLGTNDYQQMLRTFAVEDGLRIALAAHSGDMPVKPELTGNQKHQDQQMREYEADFVKWRDKILSEAEGQSSWQMFWRGFMSPWLPMTASYTTEYEEQMTDLWQQLSVLPDGGGEVRSAMLEAFRAEYPETIWYQNGKTINLGPERDFSETDAFLQEWIAGNIETMNPYEYLMWSVGMQSYRIHQNKIEHAFKAMGSTPGEVLVSGSERDDIYELNQQWEDYLDWTDSINDPKQGRSFAALFQMYQDASAKRYGDQPEIRLTPEQNIRIKAKQMLRTLATDFTEDGIRDSDYKSVVGQLTANLDGTIYGKPKSALNVAITEWWNKAGRPYIERVGAIYEEIEKTPAALRSPLYDRLRAIANRQEERVRKLFGKGMPTPEEVFWGNLEAPEQADRRLDWAGMPPEWLTNFQREKVGIPGPKKKMEKLGDVINEAAIEFEEYVKKHDLSSGSNDYAFYKDWYDQQVRQRAKELGVLKQYEDYYAAPTFERIDRIFRDEFSNSNWNATVAVTKQIYGIIESTKLDSGDFASVRGTSDTAAFYHRWLIGPGGQIDKARELDPEFGRIMDRFEKAFRESGKDLLPAQDMYWKLFFDGFGNAPDHVFE